MPRRLALLLVPVLLAAAPAPKTALQAAPTPVTLRAQPGTPLDEAARRLAAADLGADRRASDRALILVGTARLGPASDPPVLFVQLQSARDCGSAGCSTTAYHEAGGTWRKVLDSVSGPISVLPTRHAGFADLKVGDDRYAWTGTAYASLAPAPTVDLRQTILRHQATVRATGVVPRPAHPARRPTSSPARRAPAPPA
jgi:hypothetical protein